MNIASSDFVYLWGSNGSSKNRSCEINTEPIHFYVYLGKGTGT